MDITTTPPRTSPRTCNVCVERPATREVTFGGCAVRLAFCDACARDAAFTLGTPASFFTAGSLA